MVTVETGRALCQVELFCRDVDWSCWLMKKTLKSAMKDALDGIAFVQLQQIGESNSFFSVEPSRFDEVFVKEVAYAGSRVSWKGVIV